MPEPLIQQETIRYKTWVKQSLVEALRVVFATHEDLMLRKTNIGIDFPFTETEYPAIVVRFYERTIKNAGVAHFELIEIPEGSGQYARYKHYLYEGDIEFAVYALSSYDRDLISDSLVQTLTMGDTESYTNQFLNRIYSPDPNVDDQKNDGTYVAATDHFINLNTDVISGFGESQTVAPWQPEDVLVYQTSYRINIHGEFYSRTPTSQTFGLVERVETYPYMGTLGEPVPNPNPEDPAPWSEPDDAL